MKWYLLLLLALAPGRAELTEVETMAWLGLSQEERYAVVEYAVDRGWLFPCEIYTDFQYFGSWYTFRVVRPPGDPWPYGDLISTADGAWPDEVRRIQSRANRR